MAYSPADFDAFSKALGVVAPPPVGAPPPSSAPDPMDAAWSAAQQAPPSFGLPPTAPAPRAAQGEAQAWETAGKGATPSAYQQAYRSAAEQASDPARLPAQPAGAPTGEASLTSAETQGMGAGASAAGPVYHPAGWDPGRVPYRPETLKRQAEIQQAQKVVADDMASAAVQKNLVESAALNQQAEQAEKSNAEMQRREGERRSYMTSQRQQAASAVDSVARMQIDPRRLYGNADTATKMNVLIGGVMGGMLAAVNGGENSFMSQVNKNIDRDIDAQKGQIDNAKYAASGKMNMLGELRAQFGDDRMAEGVYRQQVLQAQKTRLEAAMTREQNPTILANATAAKNAIDEKMNAGQMQLDAIAHYNAYTTGGAAPADKEGEKLFVSTGAQGEGYAARDPEEAKNGRELVQLREEVINYAKDAGRLRDQTSLPGRALAHVLGTAGESPEYAQLSSKRAGIVSRLKILEKTKNASPEFQELMGQMVGDFTAVGGHPQERVKEAIKMLDSAVQSHARAQGGQGRQNELHRDANGRVYTATRGLDSFASPRAGAPATRGVDGAASGGRNTNAGQTVPDYFVQDEPGRPKK